MVKFEIRLSCLAYTMGSQCSSSLYTHIYIYIYIYITSSTIYCQPLMEQSWVTIYNVISPSDFVCAAPNTTVLTGWSLRGQVDWCRFRHRWVPTDNGLFGAHLLLGRLKPVSESPNSQQAPGFREAALHRQRTQVSFYKCLSRPSWNKTSFNQITEVAE